MRFRQINIERYGPFTDKALDFDPSKPVAVLYGPNEAGKSSLLRAIEDALFGIPKRAPYAAFRHQYKHLSIGMTLETVRDGASEILHFNRTRSGKGLLDADGAPLPPERLADALGPIDRDTFTEFFGLNAARLRSGGETLLADGGRLGESVLSAGGVLESLASRRQRLEARADEIFAPRAKKARRFYAAQERWRAAKKELADRALKAKALKTADAALKAAAERRRAAEAAVEELEKTRARDRRARAAAEILPALDVARRRLELLGPPPDDKALRRAETAMIHVESTRQNAETAARRVQDVQSRLEGEPEPSRALALADRIEAAAQAVAAAAIIENERATHAAERREVEKDKKRLARRLNVTTSDIESAAPAEPVRRAAETTLRRRAQARQNATAAAERHEQARRALSDGPVRAGAKPLGAQAVTALRRARDASWLELRAKMEAGAPPDRQRLENHEALVLATDSAADVEIAAASEAGAEDAAAGLLRSRVSEAETEAVAARETLQAVDDALEPLAAAMLPGFRPQDAEALEAAVEAAIDAWRDAEQLVKREEALAERETALGAPSADVETRAAELAADLGEAAPKDSRAAVARWMTVLRKDRAASERRQEREERLREEMEQLEEAQRDHAAAQAKAAAAAKAVNASDAAGVQFEIERAAQRAAAAQKVDQLETRLSDVAEQRDEKTLRAELEQTDLDAAAARLEAGEAHWRAAKAENNAAVAAEAEAAAARRALGVDRQAAEAARAEENAAAEMALAAEEWLTQRAAVLLLAETARRYGDRHANPILSSASRHFRNLTIDGFAQLDVALDDEGSERIVALRKTETPAAAEEVGVEEMSEGTRDQLFLALRLAAIERWSETRPSAPFIGDDLFASFDDARLGAGLKTLAARGRGAQSIILTHHIHVAEIAQRHLGEEVQIIHL